MRAVRAGFAAVLEVVIESSSVDIVRAVAHFGERPSLSPIEISLDHASAVLSSIRGAAASSAGHAVVPEGGGSPSRGGTLRAVGGRSQ